MTTMTANGISTTAGRGQEQHETFMAGHGTASKTRVQYDYRTAGGRLYSCVADTLEKCRELRDAWLSANGIKA